MHVQQQIFERVVALLGGLSLTGSRVYAADNHPLTPATMPGLTVTVDKESATGGGLRSTNKAVRIVITSYVAGDVFAEPNQIALDVATALYTDRVDGRALNGLAVNMYYNGSARRYNREAALKHTATIMEYTIDYQTADGDDSEAE